jgi:hypothetical protein
LVALGVSFTLGAQRIEFLTQSLNGLSLLREASVLLVKATRLLRDDSFQPLRVIGHDLGLRYCDSNRLAQFVSLSACTWYKRERRNNQRAQWNPVRNLQFFHNQLPPSAAPAIVQRL